MLQRRLKIIHIGYDDKIIGGVDFLAVHEHAFYGPLWTKSLGKGLFHGVHEHLYSIVAEQAFIPRCWTHPNSLADYLIYNDMINKSSNETICTYDLTLDDVIDITDPSRYT